MKEMQQRLQRMSVGALERRSPSPRRVRFDDDSRRSPSQTTTRSQDEQRPPRNPSSQQAAGYRGRNPNFRSNSQRRPYSRDAYTRCYACNSIGHRAVDCYRRQPSPAASYPAHAKFSAQYAPPQNFGPYEGQFSPQSPPPQSYMPQH